MVTSNRWWVVASNILQVFSVNMKGGKQEIQKVKKLLKEIRDKQL